MWMKHLNNRLEGLHKRGLGDRLLHKFIKLIDQHSGKITTKQLQQTEGTLGEKINDGSKAPLSPGKTDFDSARWSI